MTFTDVNTTQSSRTEAERERRWTWLRATAAPAMAIVGSVALLACDDDGSDKEASTSTTLSAAETDIAKQFIAAVNDRDMDAVEAVSTDALTIDILATVVGLQAEDLPSLMAWYDAFDWRWEAPICQTRTLGADIRCEVSERNRLTDLAEVERPATVSFTMTDGKVESVDVDADFSDYHRFAFRPFRNWVRVNHPDDFTLMWTGNVPVLSAESVALFDQHLTEYAAQPPSTTDE